MKTRAIAGSLIIVILFAVVAWYFFSNTKKEVPMPTTWTTENFGTLQGITKTPTPNPKSVVLLMHGYGSNEEDLADLGSTLSPESAVVSLRAPMQLGPGAFSWFNTDVTKSPPQANSADAMASFDLIQQAILAASDRYHVALDKFAVMGFSQGAIMTIGLVLAGQNDFGAYIAFSGRTLPDFAKAATEGDQTRYQRRPLLVFHGTHDSKLPFTNAKRTQEVLNSVHANYEFKSFEGDHTILPEEIAQAKTWLAARKLN